MENPHRREIDETFDPSPWLGVDGPESLADWVFPWPTFTVDWDQAGLIVIDCQNYCANANVGLGKMLTDRHPELAIQYLERLERIMIPNAQRLLKAFREAGKEVIFTRHGGLLPDGRDMIARRQRRDEDALERTKSPAMWTRGTYEHKIVDELTPLPDELVIDKNASSPFNGTGIDQILRNLGIETLVTVGIATDMCVETTSRDAADRGYNVIVVEDATATFLPHHHRAALSALARVYTQVRETEEVLAALR
jgi:nicotinamidase-related amidase